MQFTRAFKAQCSTEIAHAMFVRWVGTCDVPCDFESLCALVALSDAFVVCCNDAPAGFHGAQMENLLYVNTSGALSSLKLLRVTAHEWAHFLRWKQHQKTGSAWVARAYADNMAWGWCGRLLDFEEDVAHEFERLF